MRWPQLPPDLHRRPRDNALVKLLGEGVAVVALHKDVWRTTVNGYLSVGKERTSDAPDEGLDRLAGTVGDGQCCSDQARACRP